jgi:hypothetical protein
MSEMQFKYTVNFEDIVKARQSLEGLNEAQKAALGEALKLETQGKKGAKALGDGAQEAEKKVGGLNSALKTLGAAAAAFATVAWFQGAADKVDADRAAAARLDAVLKATGGTLGRTSKSLLDYADALEKSTRFSGDAIINAQAVLATFKSVSGETFDEVMTAAADLATVFNTDITSAATQLGKALEDPIKGVSALARSGVSFSEEQKALIQSLVDSNQLLEAQRIVLDQVKGQVDGAAVAVGAAGKGPWHQFGVAVEDTQKSLGVLVLEGMNKVAPMLSAIARGITTVVTTFTDWLGLTGDVNKELMQQQVNLSKGFNTLKTYNDLLASGTLTEEASAKVLTEKNEVINKLNRDFAPYLDNKITETTTQQQLNELYRIANERLVEQMTIKIKQQVLEDKLNEANERATRLIKARSGVLLEEANMMNRTTRAIEQNAAKQATQAEFNKLLADQYKDVIDLEMQLEEATKGLITVK